MAQKLILIAMAGALGTLMRYAVAGIVQKGLAGPTATGFPYGTLAVNIMGCFLFGLVYSLAEERLLISGQMRIVLLAGFMGAFTTFSTFGFETAELVRDSQWTLALANALAQNIAGIAAVFIGFAAGRIF